MCLADGFFFVFVYIILSLFFILTEHMKVCVNRTISKIALGIPGIANETTFCCHRLIALTVAHYCLFFALETEAWRLFHLTEFVFAECVHLNLCVLVSALSCTIVDFFFKKNFFYLKFLFQLRAIRFCRFFICR